KSNSCISHCTYSNISSNSCNSNKIYNNVKTHNSKTHNSNNSISNNSSSNYTSMNKESFNHIYSKRSSYSETKLDSNSFLFDNCVYNYKNLYYNETHVYKFKNTVLKNETLKTLIFFLRAFNKGPFYFSDYYNLTISLQRSYINEKKKWNEKKKTKEKENKEKNVSDTSIHNNNKNFISNCKQFPKFDKLQFDEINKEYVWNWKLLDHFIKINGFDFVVFLIHGYVNSTIINIQDNQINLYLISRKNKNRCGVRFWCRGGDEQGDVANFVETEQIVICKSIQKTDIFSYVLIRGSIPVLWKQEPTLSLRPKIT
ncbi:inositol-polyphosphate 5-phosphatase, putative, partial [Hepatocystis sp. ex Piliocolobus tephrosceles]